jgi:TPR repeat protein
VDGPADPTKAAAYFERACAGGAPGSCAAYGWALEQGDGVAKDMSRAMQVYRKACGLDDAWSCTRVAVALAGQGGVQLAESSRLLDKACELGSAPACAMLAVSTETGRGVARDPARARALYRKACDGGYAEACPKAGDP